jgi:hypothetical protein
VECIGSGAVAYFCEHGNEPSRYHRRHDVFPLHEIIQMLDGADLLTCPGHSPIVGSREHNESPGSTNDRKLLDWLRN